MSFANSSTLRYSLRRIAAVAAGDQILQVRLAHCSRLISRSPSIGLPYDILEETPLSPVADALFPLPLRELEDPLLCRYYVAQLLSSKFNLPADKCTAVAKKVAAVVADFAAEDYDEKFQLDVEIDWIDVFWVEEQGNCVRVEQGSSVRGLYVEEIVVLEPVSLPAPTRASPETKHDLN